MNIDTIGKGIYLDGDNDTINKDLVKADFLISKVNNNPNFHKHVQLAYDINIPVLGLFFFDALPYLQGNYIMERRGYPTNLLTLPEGHELEVTVGSKIVQGLICASTYHYPSEISNYSNWYYFGLELAHEMCSKVRPLVWNMYSNFVLTDNTFDNTKIGITKYNNEPVGPEGGIVLWDVQSNVGNPPTTDMPNQNRSSRNGSFWITSQNKYTENGISGLTGKVYYYPTKDYLYTVMNYTIPPVIPPTPPTDSTEVLNKLIAIESKLDKLSIHLGVK